MIIFCKLSSHQTVMKGKLFFDKTLQDLAQVGESELVRDMVRDKSNRIDVNAVDHLGRIALHEACWNGHRDVVDVLLHEPCNTDVNLKNSFGTFPLFLAAWAGHHQIVQSLLGHSSTDPNLTDAFNTTALHKACEKGHIECVRALLTSTTLNTNLKDFIGATPLYECIRKGNIEITKLLMLDKRVDPNLEAKRGWTPIRRAFLRIRHPESLDIMTILLEDERIKVDINFARHMVDEDQSPHALHLAYLLCKYKDFKPTDLFEEKSPQLQQLQRKLKLLHSKAARPGKLPHAKKKVLENNNLLVK